MPFILSEIKKAVASEKKLLTVLIDPDKFKLSEAATFLQKLPEETSFLFVGGSTANENNTEDTIEGIRRNCHLPVIIFPGDYSQINGEADGLLFLSLISGRNPEYLIGQQVKAIPFLQKTSLEVIPTGYILIEGGKESAVARVSGTEPLSQNKVDVIVQTAMAGEYSGKQLIYLEAGSGAAFPVANEIISEVKKAISVPLVVGGGIRSENQLQAAYASGADMVVIGSAFEEGTFFIN